MQATVDAARRPLWRACSCCSRCCARRPARRRRRRRASAPRGRRGASAGQSAAGEVVRQARRPRSGGAQGPAALRVAADGVFGPQTERAVRRFQRRKGLTADGVVGPQTRDALGLDAVRAQLACGASRAACGCRACCAGSPSASRAATRRAVSPDGQLSRQVPVQRRHLARPRRRRAIPPTPPRPSRTGSRSSCTGAAAPRPGRAAPSQRAAGERAGAPRPGRAAASVARTPTPSSP